MSDDNLVAQTPINQGYDAIDLFILIWVDFKLSLFKKESKRSRRKKILLFTVTEFNKNLLDSKRLPYCFCFGVENVILVLFLGKKISCCYKSYVYGKMLFFNTEWLTYFRSINGIINKHFANLKCEIWIIIKTHLSAQLSILRLHVDHGGIFLMNILLLSPLLPPTSNAACILSVAVHGKDFSCVMSSWGLRCIFAFICAVGRLIESVLYYKCLRNNNLQCTGMLHYTKFFI